MHITFDRTRALAALAALGIAFVIVAILVAPRSRGSIPPPAAAPTTGSCADLASQVDPATVPVDSGYDAEKNLVYAHYAGRTYSMDPDDAFCRSLPSVRALIDDTMNADRENLTVACRVMRTLVESKQPDFRGKRVDRQAAQRFIARRCGAA